MHSIPCIFRALHRLSSQRCAAFRMPALTLAFAMMLIVAGRVATVYGEGELSVVIKDGETLRDLADKYLKDPDLWEEILRANDIDDMTVVVPGKKLKIPLATIARANQSLAAALSEIQRATQAGARVFAKDKIGEAIELYDTALSYRQSRAWEQVPSIAKKAQGKAQEAAAVTMAKRDAKAEAILSHRQGLVHRRKFQDNLWKEAALNDVVIEQERIRTLSRSQAGLTFWDESHLRLNENSQAIIRSMRVDHLTQKQDTKVHLVAGDAHVLLKGVGARKQFDVGVKGVELRHASRNFWLKRDVDVTKVGNYDTGRMHVTAAGATVVIGKNQGTIVQDQQPPTPAIELLQPPPLLAPADNANISPHQTALTWRPVENAASYWLEVALDAEFWRSVASHWGIKESRFAVTHLEPGIYHWRVAAIDGSGLLGPKSKVRRFSLQIDTNTPYLMIASPGEGDLAPQSPIRVVGATESHTTLKLNGHPVSVEVNGTFGFDHELQKGVNLLSFEVVDRAGLVTRRERAVIYLPNEAAIIRYARSLARLQDKHFLTSGDTLSLSGTTTANWQIQVPLSSGRTQVSTFADASGHFDLNIPVQHQSETFTLRAISPSGFVTTDIFRVTRDQEPPTITVDAPPPSVTQIPELWLQGQVQGAHEVKLNGRFITLAGDRFDERIPLRQGKNRIELMAADPVGNKAVSSWAIVHDVIPPELVSHRLSRARSSGSEVLIIEVVARDVSGLKQVAPYRLQVGKALQSGFLRLNQVSQQYQGILPLPQGDKRAAKLISVELEDYAGNRKAYAFK